MDKIVVYTAIFGGYDKLLEQKKFENVDFVCFSDTPFSSKTWQVEVVKNLPCGLDHTRNNRFYKILPHKSFPDYRYSIYLDGNILLKKHPAELIQNVLAEEKMACFDHNQALQDPRNCIYEEYEAIMKLAEKTGRTKDDPEVMKQQISRLKAEGYPQNNGLLVGGVLVRLHNDPEVIKVMEEWWQMVKNYSKRDQLSFNYVAWRNKFQYATIHGDIRRKNRFVYIIGKHSGNLKYQLLKYRLRTLFSKFFS